MSEPAAPRADEAAAVAALVASHREFLAFLERRLGDRDLAEDLLQAAFVKSLERVGTLRAQESLRAWFYRMLRNAVVDHHRRTTTARGALERVAALRDEGWRDPDVDAAVCQCVARLAETLPPAYARAIRRLELDEVPVKEFAAEEGITRNNAAVRAFRAREALRRQVARACGTCAEHGCLDCACK